MMHGISNKKSFLTTTLLTLLALKNVSSVPTTAYQPVQHELKRSEKLILPGILTLNWRLRDNSSIVFEVIVNSKGFVALGFSFPNDNIRDSDIALIWIDDHSRKPNILDCYGSRSDFKNIKKDDTQNFVIIEGHQNQTHTVVKFKRQISTCDPFDFPFSKQTVNVSFGFGDKDVVASKLDELVFRFKGSKRIRLFDPSFDKSEEPNFSTWDTVVKDATINEKVSSIYWCKFLRVPNEIMKEKRQIIGWEPLFFNKTQESLVHHVTLFECQMDANLNQWSKSNGDICHSDSSYSSSDWEACLQPIATWRKGGGSTFLPDHTGITLNGSYYMMEIFCVNPKKKSFKLNSGLRIFHTNKLRKFEAGIFITGVLASETQIIPPQQNSWRNYGVCSFQCISNGSIKFPHNGLNIISVNGLTHANGYKIRMSLVRNNTEIDTALDDHFYSSDYQESWKLMKELKVYKDDYLITECTYKTKGRQWVTLGGYSNEDETCLASIIYYPKIDLVGCYSMIPIVEFFNYFDVEKFYNYNMTDVENMMIYGQDQKTSPNHAYLNNNDNFSHLYNGSVLNSLVIEKPIQFQDKPFTQHLNILPWDDEVFSATMEENMHRGSHQLSCRVSNVKHHASTIIIKYPNFTSKEEEINFQCPGQQYLQSTSSSKSKFTKKSCLMLISMTTFQILQMKILIV